MRIYAVGRGNIRYIASYPVKVVSVLLLMFWNRPNEQIKTAKNIRREDRPKHNPKEHCRRMAVICSVHDIVATLFGTTPLNVLDTPSHA